MFDSSSSSDDEGFSPSPDTDTATTIRSKPYKRNNIVSWKYELPPAKKNRIYKSVVSEEEFLGELNQIESFMVIHC